MSILLKNQQQQLKNPLQPKCFLITKHCFSEPKNHLKSLQCTIKSHHQLCPLDRNYTEVNGIVVTLRSPSFDSSIPPFSLQPSRSLKNSVKYSLTHSLPPSEQALDAQNHFTFSLLKKTTLFNSCSCKLFACIQPADRMNAQTLCACAHRMYMWVII